MNTDASMPTTSLSTLPATLRNVAGIAALIALLAAIVLGAWWAHGAGWGLVSVHGGSMGDTIPTGSLVIAKKEPAANVAVGDVILIRQQAEDGTTLAPKLHRVVAVDDQNGQVVVQTKGDANSEPDPDRYVLRQQTLVEQWHIPRLGYWIGFVSTPQGWALVAALPFVTVAAIIIASIWRRKPIQA